MVSSWLATFHMSVRVWSGMFGSFEISSSMEMLDAALTAGLSLVLSSMFFTLSALRLMFLGTVSSSLIRDSTSTHCFMTASTFDNFSPSGRP